MPEYNRHNEKSYSLHIKRYRSHVRNIWHTIKNYPWAQTHRITSRLVYSMWHFMVIFIIYLISVNIVVKYL